MRNLRSRRLETGSMRHIRTVWRANKADFLSDLSWFLKMERSKKSPVSNTVMYSTVFLSFAACFVGLIHVKIELHAHRQMLRVLNQQRQENIELRATLYGETIDTPSQILHSDSRKAGEWLYSVLLL